MPNLHGPPKKVVTWTELILLTLLVLSGMGIWIFTEQEVAAARKSNEPDEETYQEQSMVLARQLELSGSQAELAALQGQLIEQRLQLVRQSFKVDSMLAAYPKLHDISTTSESNASISKETVRAYVNARIELDTARGVAEALASGLEQCTRNVVDKAGALVKAKSKATSDLTAALERFRLRGRFIALAWAGGAIAVFFVVAFALLSLLVGNGSFEVNRGVVLGCSSLLLCILIGYATLGVMGAAALGTLISIVILIFVSRNGDLQVQGEVGGEAKQEKQQQ